MLLPIPIAIGCVSHAVNPTVASEPFGDISGVVRDSASGEPITGASVRVEGSNPIRSAPTNALGKFRLNHVSTGKHTLLLRRIGYNAKRVPVAIDLGRTRSISVSMSQSTDCDIGCDELVTVNPPAAAAIPHFRPDSVTTGDNGERLAAVVGTVVDSATGRPLEAATVEVRARPTTKRGVGAFADAHGGFVIGRIEPGSYQIIVRRLGWLPATQDWNARAGKIDNVQFRLAPGRVEIQPLNR